MSSALGKDEALKKYRLVRPLAEVYPFDPDSGAPEVYPDFESWQHAPQQDEIAVALLHKGYVTPAVVGNELLSARSIIQQSLQLLVDGDKRGPSALMQRLSRAMLRAIQLHEQNTVVAASTHRFRFPPRVTLTDQRRELWLSNLANPHFPLRQLSRTIPHGLKKQRLLQQCVDKRLPLLRAIWFLKCICGNEVKSMLRKVANPQARATALALIEQQWVSEWTSTLLDHLRRTMHDLLVLGGRVGSQREPLAVNTPSGTLVQIRTPGAGGIGGNSSTHTPSAGLGLLMTSDHPEPAAPAPASSAAAPLPAPPHPVANLPPQAKRLRDRIKQDVAYLMRLVGALQMEGMVDEYMFLMGVLDLAGPPSASLEPPREQSTSLPPPLPRHHRESLSGDRNGVRLNDPPRLECMMVGIMFIDFLWEAYTRDRADAAGEGVRVAATPVESTPLQSLMLVPPAHSPSVAPAYSPLGMTLYSPAEWSSPAMGATPGNHPTPGAAGTPMAQLPTHAPPTGFLQRQLVSTLVKMYVHLQQYQHALLQHHDRQRQQLASLPFVQRLLLMLQEKISVLYRTTSADNFIVPEIWPQFLRLLARHNWLVQGDLQDSDGDAQEGGETGSADGGTHEGCRRYWETLAYRNECLCGVAETGDMLDGDGALQGADTFRRQLAIVAQYDRCAEDLWVPGGIDALVEMVLEVELPGRGSSLPSSSGSTPLVGDAVPPTPPPLALVLLVHWSCLRFRTSDMLPVIAARLICQCIIRLHASGEAAARVAFERRVLAAVYEVPELVQRVVGLLSGHRGGESLLDLHVDMARLHRLVCRLFHAKVFTIGGYVRKLMSSGILYGENGVADFYGSRQFHVAVLRSLPIAGQTANENQVNMILRKLGQSPLELDAGLPLMAAQRELQQLADYVLSGHQQETDLPPQLWDRHLSLWHVCSQLLVHHQLRLCSWFVAELRRQLATTTDVVPVTPAKIVAVYRFYAAARHETQFFVEFVDSLLLRNDDKVMVYYLDTLYVVGQLVRLHHQLFLWETCGVSNGVGGSAGNSAGVGMVIGDSASPELARLRRRDVELLVLPASQQPCLFLQVLQLVVGSYQELKVLKDSDMFHVLFVEFWQFSLRMVASGGAFWRVDEVSSGDVQLMLEGLITEENALRFDTVNLAQLAAQVTPALAAPEAVANVLVCSQPLVAQAMRRLVQCCGEDGQEQVATSPEAFRLLQLLHYYLMSVHDQFIAMLREYLVHLYLDRLSGGGSPAAYRVMARLVVYRVVELAELVQLVLDVDVPVRKVLASRPPQVEVVATPLASTAPHYWAPLFDLLFGGDTWSREVPVDEQLRLQLAVQCFREAQPQRFLGLLTQALQGDAAPPVELVVFRQPLVPGSARPQRSESLLRRSLSATLPAMDPEPFESIPLMLPASGVPLPVFEERGYTFGLPERYRDAVRQAVVAYAPVHMSWLLDTVFKDRLVVVRHYSGFFEVLLQLCGADVDVNEALAASGGRLGWLSKVVPLLNCFSLCFCQLLVRVVLEAEVEQLRAREGVRDMLWHVAVQEQLVKLETVIGETSERFEEVCSYMLKPFQVALLQESQVLFLSQLLQVLMLVDPEELGDTSRPRRLVTVTTGVINKVAQMVGPGSVELPQALLEQFANLVAAVCAALQHASPQRGDFELVLGLVCKLLLLNHRQVVQLAVGTPLPVLQHLVALVLLPALASSQKLQVHMYDVLRLMATAAVAQSTEKGDALGKLALFVEQLEQVPRPATEHPFRAQWAARERQGGSSLVGGTSPPARWCVDADGRRTRFRVKPMDMLEDSTPVGSINDAALNMSLFGATVERVNPG